MKSIACDFLTGTNKSIPKSDKDKKYIKGKDVNLTFKFIVLSTKNIMKLISIIGFEYFLFFKQCAIT